MARLTPTQQAALRHSERCIFLAKWYAKRQGIKGRSGGWLYNADGRVVCQGYFEYYHRHRQQIWDAVNA